MMRAARRAALIAPGLPMAVVPTGTPGGICTMAKRASMPCNAEPSRGTPITGRRVWAATTNLALDLILKRVGVGILPRHVAAPFVARKRLRLVEPGKRVLTDSMWWKKLSGPGARASPALEAFREAAIEAFSDLALD